MRTLNLLDPCLLHITLQFHSNSFFLPFSPTPFPQTPSPPPFLPSPPQDFLFPPSCFDNSGCKNLKLIPALVKLYDGGKKAGHLKRSSCEVRLYMCVGEGVCVCVCVGVLSVRRRERGGGGDYRYPTGLLM